MTKKRKKQTKSALKAQLTPKPSGLIRVEYQPDNGEGPQWWTPHELDDEVCTITELGGHGPTYGQFVCLLESLYRTLNDQFGTYARKVTFTFPKEREAPSTWSRTGGE